MNPAITQAIKTLLDTLLVEAPKQMATLLWNIVISLLAAHWLVIGLTLLVILVVSTLRAMMGYWAPLASLLYNVIYFGVLLIIGTIWGPEVFVSDPFTFFTAVVLYPSCYLLVNWILKRTGILSR